MRIDEMNKKILYLLQQDGRMTYKDIAKAINRSESTVRDRISIMEDEGVIKGYSAIVDRGKVGLHCCARLFAKARLEELDSLSKKLAEFENIFQIDHVSGDHNLRFTVAAHDYSQLKRVINTQIANLPLEIIQIDIIMKSLKEGGPLKLQ
ncbi:MAG: Lrp/AsnC family transcriptional regulator [Halobacteriota archaeon]|jgi:Lrp/AsnC family transcriptional regulator for asnA, asnC and gidA